MSLLAGCFRVVGQACRHWAACRFNSPRLSGESAEPKSPSMLEMESKAIERCGFVPPSRGISLDCGDQGIVAIVPVIVDA